VDYFTKWVEVEPLVNITAKSIERFLWKNVVCRYGVPHAFVTDNGKQFDCDSFRKWCAELHIRNLLLISRTSSGKRASRSYQQDNFQNFEKEVGRQERRLGRRSPRSSLGVSNHKKNSNGRNPLCSCFRN
jgi:hypothetical protein